MNATERAGQSWLPVRALIDRVLLIAGAQVRSSWRTLQEIRLPARIAVPLGKSGCVTNNEVDVGVLGHLYVAERFDEPGMHAQN